MDATCVDKNCMEVDMIERKMIQRKSVSLILFFFTIIAILSFRVDGVYASTNGRTQAQAVAWANAHVGGPGLDIDGRHGAQCVDFICYYYLELGQAYPWGNACDYVNGGENSQGEDILGDLSSCKFPE